MVSKVSNRIPKQILKAHIGFETGIPPAGIMHRHNPIARPEAVHPRYQSVVHLIELANNTFPPEQSRSKPRPDRIYLVKDGRAEVEDPSKELRKGVWQLAKKNQQNEQGPHEYKA